MFNTNISNFIFFRLGAVLVKNDKDGPFSSLCTADPRPTAAGQDCQNLPR